MRVLVTGANGFVGTALLGRLVEHREFVAIAATRRPDDLNAFSDTLEVRTAPDLGPGADWRDVVREVNVVIHLAARVHVVGENDATAALNAHRHANVEGTRALAEQAARAGVRRLVYVSTVKVNGEGTPPGRSFTEDDVPGPTDPYGIAKAEAERMLQTNIARHMEIVIVRPPLVYGPGVKANFLAMAKWLKRGVPLPLGAVTDNRRSLVAVDNLVSLLLECARQPSAANQVFLVSDGEDLSTRELLVRTARALNVRPRLLPVPVTLLRASATALGRRDIWQRLGGSLQVSIEKARSRLAWIPPVSVDEGLRRAVRHLM